MKYYKSATGMLVEILILLQFVTQVPGELYYDLEFTDSIMSCPDFENKHLKADSLTLGLKEGEGDEPGGFGITGDLDVLKPMDTDHDIILEICKETEVSCEPMMTATTNLCDSMKEEDVPWFPIFSKMNVSSCPIDARTYKIENLILSLEPFKHCLSHEFCGYYAVKISVVKQVDVIACNLAYIEIVERQEE